MRAVSGKQKRKMRTDIQIFNLILSVAKNDERVRAVILNGSRVNTKIVKDDLQDFDIVYIVTELDSFIANPTWIDVFGERIILQTPNSIKLIRKKIVDVRKGACVRPHARIQWLFRVTSEWAFDPKIV